MARASPGSSPTAIQPSPPGSLPEHFLGQKRTRNGRVFEPGKRAVFLLPPYGVGYILRPENGRETCAAKLDLLGKKPLSAHSEVCHCVESLGTTHVALTCFSLRESPGPTRNRPRSTPFLRAHRRTHSRSRCRCVRLDFLVAAGGGRSSCPKAASLARTIAGPLAATAFSFCPDSHSTNLSPRSQSFTACNLLILRESAMKTDTSSSSDHEDHRFSTAFTQVSGHTRVRSRGLLTRGERLSTTLSFRRCLRHSMSAATLSRYWYMHRMLPCVCHKSSRAESRTASLMPSTFCCRRSCCCKRRTSDRTAEALAMLVRLDTKSE